MATATVAVKENGGKGIQRDEIFWKLKFLAYACGSLHKSDNQMEEGETCGLMLILEGLANEIYPESEKAGAV